jgi:twitching motility protein PilT
MATPETSARGISAYERFQMALKWMVGEKGSDLHVSAGSGFRVRLKGKLVEPPGNVPLGPADTATVVAGILLASRKCNKENVAQTVAGITDFDCSYSMTELGRFRVNIASQRGSLALVLRHIPLTLPTVETLGLPKVLGEIAMTERGLILLTGVTGSGKSSTLAAMINHVNHHKQHKIITIEDPIEFLYRDEKCSIMQRECGADTEGFGKALRAALRQDPDIILVGEMRDKETIDIAIKAAETGHLVFSTVHTTDAPKTISRLISVFEPAEQTALRLRLAETLKAVISQRLLPRADGTGRVVACEIMRQTKSIQDCIADPDKTDSMKDYIEKGKEMYGMQTFDQCLTDLYRQNLIDLETAKGAATSPADFERNLQFQ